MKLKFLTAIFGIALAISLTGCGGGKGVLRGSVSYKGIALKQGSITLISNDGNHAAGQIDPNGNYEVFDVIPGDYKIGIISTMDTGAPAPSPEDIKKMKGGAGGGMKSAIPEHFGDPERSGLKYTVKSGSNEYPIDLQ
jgi:hypothetical protein